MSINADLFIYDEEFTDYHKKYSEIAENGQKQITEFYAILESLKIENAIQGATGDKLFAFLSLIRQALNTQMHFIATANSTYMSSYIDEIDVADDVLFTED